MTARLRHIWLVLSRLPAILLNQGSRARFLSARGFLRDLPIHLKRPLPEAMAGLTPRLAPDPPSPALEKDLRETADIAALLDRRSPLGLCLRRSLLRYHFLRQAGLPLEVHFGARFKEKMPDRQVTGHAWVTLNGAPYHEEDENWRDFTVMLTFPDPAA